MFINPENDFCVNSKRRLYNVPELKHQEISGTAIYLESKVMEVRFSRNPKIMLHFNCIAVNKRHFFSQN